MNGYDLAERMRKTRRRHRLSAATQALYYELVAICNEEGWPDEFKCSNDELCAALQISEKSLITYRLELIQSRLLYYLSGKSKKKIGSYSFSKEFFNGCKFYNQSDSLMGSQSGSQSDSQPGEKPPDSIKTKTKLFVIIAKSEKLVEYLTGLFIQDEGLQMKWRGNGLPAADFSKGVELWGQRHHGREYKDFREARDHLFNWIPFYNSESEKKEVKKNGSHQQSFTGKPGKSEGANILLDMLKNEINTG